MEHGVPGLPRDAIAIAVVSFRVMLLANCLSRSPWKSLPFLAKGRSHKRSIEDGANTPGHCGCFPRIPNQVRCGLTSEGLLILIHHIGKVQKLMGHGSGEIVFFSPKRVLELMSMP